MVVIASLCRTLLTSRFILCGRKTVKYAEPYFIRHVSHSFPRSTVTSRPVGKILAIMCCFGAGGGAYAYLTAPKIKQKVASGPLVPTDPFILSSVPSETISRTVLGPANVGLRFTLYQYQSCPFCCKVRAFLDYYGISYNVVEVNPVMRQQLKFSKYRKVPILIAHDEETDHVYQLNDSSAIMSILGTYLLNTQEKLSDVLELYHPVSYTNEEGKEVTEVLNQYFLMYGEKNHTDKTEELREEQKWRKWADQDFVHVLSPNIYRTAGEAVESFNHFSKVGEWEKNFSTFERLTVIYVGAAAMYLIGKRLKKKYGLKPDVRDSLYDSCRLWMKNVGKSQFMGGSSPNLADLSMYGLLSSIEGCMAFQDLLRNTNIGSWYYNMKECVKKHDGFNNLALSKS